MNEFIKKIDSKTKTSDGGILLAGFLAYTIYKILTNDLDHINTSLEKTAEVQVETNVVLSGINKTLESKTEVLRGNTKILEKLEYRLK